MTLPLRSAVLAAAVSLGTVALVPAAAEAVDILAVTDRGEMLRFSDAAPGQAIRRGIHGVGGRPIAGIDVRPADGRVHLLTVDGAVLVMDPVTGRAEFKSMLGVALAPAPGYLVDFNPVADRLRVVGAGGQNLRVDVDTGTTIVDGPVRFADGAPAAVAAGAYTNSVRGTTATQLYVIDAATGAYALQNPPNEGVLGRVGMTGVAGVDGADIWSDGTRNVGYAVAGNVFYVFDPATGTAREVGPIGASVVGRIIDIAVLPPGM